MQTENPIISTLAAELVGLKVDVIVSSGPIATRPAKGATSTIPIVMTFDDDPVGSGFVPALRDPAGIYGTVKTIS
jgi:putative tryptophan/tyrosine transport system substrate-binding protein